MRGWRRVTLAGIAAAGGMLVIGVGHTSAASHLTVQPLKLSRSASLKGGEVTAVSSGSGEFPAGDNFVAGICASQYGQFDCKVLASGTIASDGSVPPTPMTLPASPVAPDSRAICPPADFEVADGYPCVVFVDTGSGKQGGVALYYKGPAPSTTSLGSGRVSLKSGEPGGLACAAAPTFPATPCAAGETFKVLKQSLSGGGPSEVGTGTANADGTWMIPSVRLGRGSWRVWVKGDFSTNTSHKVTVVIP